MSGIVLIIVTIIATVVSNVLSHYIIQRFDHKDHKDRNKG